MSQTGLLWILSTQYTAIGIINMPPVEAVNAKFDIRADAGKTLSLFDHVPNRAILTITQNSGGLAICTFNLGGIGFRFIASELHIAHGRNSNLWQLRNVTDLIAKIGNDSAQNALLAADSSIDDNRWRRAKIICCLSRNNECQRNSTSQKYRFRNLFHPVHPAVHVDILFTIEAF